MKKISIIVGLLVIICAILIVINQQKQKSVSNQNTSTLNNGNTIELASYTISDVAMHKTQSDCWTIVNGDVYDVTSWIAKHPGGAKAIISMCGVDASQSFSNQHGGQKRPASELASFKIGVLK